MPNDRRGFIVVRHDAPSSTAYRDAPERGLVVTQRWRNAYASIVVLASIVADLWLAVCYLDHWKWSLGWRASGWQWLLAGVFAAACLGLTYAAAAMMLNRTRLAVDADAVRVRHAPLPWWPHRTLQRALVRRVRAYETPIGVDDTTPPTRDVRVEIELVDGRSFSLLRGLDDLSQASSIAREINTCLGIAPQ